MPRLTEQAELRQMRQQKLHEHLHRTSSEYLFRFTAVFERYVEEWLALE